MKNSIFLLILLALCACKSPKQIQSSHETVRIIERQVRDTILPGFNVQTELSIPEFLERRIYDTLKIIDPLTKGELLLWKNRYGALEAECIGRDQTITKLQESIKDFQSNESQTIVQVDSRSWWQRIVSAVPWYVLLLVGFVLGLAIRLRPF